MIRLKRDLDLMRHMMLRIEEKASWGKVLQRVDFQDLCNDLSIVAGHLRLLREANYINAQSISSASGENYFVYDLTFQGHDYLDSIRDDSVWHEVKQKIATVVGAASVEVVKAAADMIIRSRLGLM